MKIYVIIKSCTSIDGNKITTCGAYKNIELSKRVFEFKILDNYNENMPFWDFNEFENYYRQDFDVLFTNAEKTQWSYMRDNTLTEFSIQEVELED